MEKIKKKKIILTVIIVMIIAVTASLLIILTLSIYKSEQKQLNESLSVEYITSSVIEKMEYQNLSEISSENIPKYYEISDDIVSESDMYISSGSDSITEIACFKLTDESKQDELMKAISDYLSSKSSTYKNVNEKDSQNITNSRVEIKYPYVFVVISNDCDSAVTAFNSLTDTKN